MPLDHGANAVNKGPVTRFIKSRRFLYRPALFVRNAVLGGAMRVLGALCGTRRQAIFSSFHGLVYGDGPMRVSEKLHELDPGLPILWLLFPGCAGQERVPDYVTVIRPRTFRALKELSRSAVCVDNFNLPYYRVRGKDRYVVQLWHGDRPFKKIMFDAAPGEPVDIRLQRADAPFQDGQRLFRRGDAAVHEHGVLGRRFQHLLRRVIRVLRHGGKAAYAVLPHAGGDARNVRAGIGHDAARKQDHAAVAVQLPAQLRVRARFKAERACG